MLSHRFDNGYFPALSSRIYRLTAERQWVTSHLGGPKMSWKWRRAGDLSTHPNDFRLVLLFIQIPVRGAANRCGWLCPLADPNFWLVRVSANFESLVCVITHYYECRSMCSGLWRAIHWLVALAITLLRKWEEERTDRPNFQYLVFTPALLLSPG